MKFETAKEYGNVYASHPTRGEWIEMLGKHAKLFATGVSPHTG